MQRNQDETEVAEIRVEEDETKVEEMTRDLKFHGNSNRAPLSFYRKKGGSRLDAIDTRLIPLHPPSQAKPKAISFEAPKRFRPYPFLDKPLSTKTKSKVPENVDIIIYGATRYSQPTATPVNTSSENVKKSITTHKMFHGSKRYKKPGEYEYLNGADSQKPKTSI